MSDASQIAYRPRAAATPAKESRYACRFLQLVDARRKVRALGFCSSASGRTAFSLATVLLLASAGCGHAKKAVDSTKKVAGGVVDKVTLKPSPLNLNVGIDPAANGNSPVALDVVLIKDKNFWKAAPAMSAKDWFAQRSDLERRYRSKLQVQSWEWVPGQPIAPIVVKVPRWCSGAMVFADYPSPGSHSAPIPLGGKVTISLQPNDFLMETKP
jgi:type VI secretion system protein